ncbi:MAG: NADP-specific glutamate dehydrogenase [Desulfobacteraceae bacterium]|nr:MAG: NADP-specific glutamate dehydrogenase [Desulfobacteraceae bacterium]
MDHILALVRSRNPEEKEFHQAVQEVIESVRPVLERHPEYRYDAVLERLTEPERVILFQVPWMDDQGHVKVNRGFRVQMNSSLGPYKGGLRFHPSVNLSIMKFLAFEQVLKNALTTLSLGGARGGSDFDPKGKSDNEMMRFCQSFMLELFRHIGPDTDIPEGDIGVGTREIGYLFGAYRKVRNEFTGVLTGKGLGWGGSLIRPEAPGYGVVYFAAEMLASRSDSLEGKKCLISGSGAVAQHTAEKIIELGGKVLTLSDSSGYIFDEEGVDRDKLAFVKRIKNIRRGRIEEYVEKYSQAIYTETDATLDYHPLWDHWADCAFPCATQNEIKEKDAYNLINHKIRLVCEGADMPCTPKAIDIFMDKKLLYVPGKAANAGGVAVSGLEMAQNSMRLSWTAEEIDSRLKMIMKRIHRNCLDAAAEYGVPGNYLIGANIAGFIKVVNAMRDQGVI